MMRSVGGRVSVLEEGRFAEFGVLKVCFLAVEILKCAFLTT